MERGLHRSLSVSLSDTSRKSKLSHVRVQPPRLCRLDLAFGRTPLIRKGQGRSQTQQKRSRCQKLTSVWPGRCRSQNASLNHSQEVSFSMFFPLLGNLASRRFTSLSPLLCPCPVIAPSAEQKVKITFRF